MSQVAWDGSSATWDGTSAFWDGGGEVVDVTASTSGGNTSKSRGSVTIGSSTGVRPVSKTVGS